MSNIFKEKLTFLTLMKYALPSILMQIFLSLYSIVDGVFVSRLVGSEALAAINIAYPAVSLMIAIAIMFATGGSAIVAKLFGEKQDEKARSVFTFIILTALILGIGLSIAVAFMINPLVRLLGATGSTFPYAATYLSYMLPFIPAAMLQILFQVFFITAGKPNLGLRVTFLAGITNMVLDYLFIGPLDMGIKGAALATGIGYLIPALIGLYYFSRRSGRKLYWVKPRAQWVELMKTLSNGSSEFITNVSAAVITFLINIMFVKYYGDSGVAAITIVLYFQFIFLAIYSGYAMGIAPIISYKFGEKNWNDLKVIFKNSQIFLISVSVLAFIGSLMTINPLLHFFTRDAEVLAIAKAGFLYFAPSLALMSVAIFASSFFTALSNGKVSAIISFARTFVFLASSLLLLPMIMGGDGLWLATTLAEVLGLLVAIYYILKLKNHYHYL